MDNKNNNSNSNNVTEIIEIVFNDHQVPLMEPWGYYLSAVILFLIGFFGFSFNIFVVIVMCRDVKLWTPMNIILFNLICSDLSVSIIGNPLTLTAAIHQKWIFGRIICVAYGFFMSLLGICSITTLTVLAYERYHIVTCLNASPFTNYDAIILIGLIWLYSLALTTPPLFGWGAYVNEAANISCSVNWESQTYNATSYIIFLFIFGLVIPVLVISYSYINIILTMRRNARRLGRGSSKQEMRITWMVAIMILAFLIAWTPYAAFALIEQFGPKDMISAGMAVLPALFAKSSICYNPLIYVGLNTQFKTSLKRRTMNRESIVFETSIHHLSQQIEEESIENLECASNFMKQSKDVLLSEKSVTKLIQNNSNNTDNSCKIKHNNNLTEVSNHMITIALKTKENEELSENEVNSYVEL